MTIDLYVDGKLARRINATVEVYEQTKPALEYFIGRCDETKRRGAVVLRGEGISYIIARAG